MEQFPFTQALTDWFKTNARDLPWRNTSNPYHIWLSEIMLQQTRVVAVIEYYHRFLDQLPTIEDLANCPQDQLMKLWQGLGYYNRARNLQKAALQIVENHEGKFPHTYAEIKNLSGIGEYTAGAIASNAFHLPYPSVDGNVLRVVARYTNNPKDILSTPMKKEVTQWVNHHMPFQDYGTYNQALMELGAVLCLPNGAPNCTHCPVQEGCACANTELWKTIPRKMKKKPRKIENKQVFLLYQNGRIAIQKRPPTGVLADLWEFPNIPENETPWLTSISQNTSPLTTGKHIFTHLEWHMTAYEIHLAPEEATPEAWVFATKEEIREKYSIPSAFSFLFPYLFQKINKISSSPDL